MSDWQWGVGSKANAEERPAVGLNREGWLTEAAVKIQTLFRGFTLGKYRVTCGWPCKGALARKATRVGECHSQKSSKDGTHEIFISPLLEEDAVVAGTLCHELAHVAAGIEAQHGGGFIKVCKHVGLTKGRPTSAMPGDRLKDQIAKLIGPLGKYPHVAMAPARKERVVEPSRVKLVCPCGCLVTMGVKWLEEVGLPTCACGEGFEVWVPEG